MFGFIPFNYLDDEDDEIEEEDEVLGLHSDPDDLWLEIRKLRTEVEKYKKDLKAAAEILDLAVQAASLEDKPILLLKYKKDLTQEYVDDLAEMWKSRHPDGIVMCLPEDLNLDTLNDDDLKLLGLKRVGRLSEKDYYDEMLRGRI